jgi:peroxiredoxin
MEGEKRKGKRLALEGWRYDVTWTMSEAIPAVVPEEGWHVLHLFYKIEYGQWSLLGADEQLSAKTDLTALVQEIRATPETQLLTFAVVSSKADLGFMLLTPDLHIANAFEKRLSLALGPDVLSPVYSYFSMTERSEYVTSEEEYAAALKEEKGMAPGSVEFEAAMEDFRTRMVKYGRDKLYPNLPGWPVLCFYPMSKRRNPGQNWFALPFEERKTLMAAHARVGRRWHGKIRQLITGSTGLDDAEWGVTLFAHRSSDIKGIVYEMRFDPVSAEYAEFGEFYIGLQLALDDLFRRVQI